MRKRKPGVVWLPALPEASISNDGIILVVEHDISGPTGSRITSVHSLTLDNPAEQAVAVGDSTSLSDFEGSAYRLRRIVGKFFGAITQNQDAAGLPTAVITTVGFIVLRVDPITGLPVGGGAADANYSPQAFGSERDPWIWRRSYILSNALAANTFANAWPTATTDYGSVSDGPHIDAKTARVVKDEERLFFVISTSVFERLGTGQETTPVKYALDYRILASMLKMSGNRRNASR